jgi:tetratricopeptide (TPR) repeat protein
MRLPDPTPLQAAALALLREVGPLYPEELLARLLAEGFDLGADAAGALDEALIDRDDIDELPDGLLLHPAATVEGAVATTRLTAEELDLGVVELEPELELLLLLAELLDLTLVGGGTARIEFVGPDVAAGVAGRWQLHGPPGWLGSVRPDRLTAFRLAGDVLHIETPAETGDVESAAAALRAAYDEQDPDGDGIETRHLLLAVLVDDPEVLRQPLPPLTELLEAAGLVAHGDWVHDAGWDAAPFGHGLDERAQEALGILRGTLRLALSEPQAMDDLRGRPEVLGALSIMLADEAVAEAFVTEALPLGEDAEAVAPVRTLASIIVDAAPEQPGPCWVLAACEEHLGNAEAAERHLLAALCADPDFLPALLDAARCAGDRGDAVRALSLLRRAGADPDDGQVRLLERYAAPGPASAGRNEQCPCGSGRKYKVCCARRNGHALVDRVPWLLTKAASYCQRPAQRQAVAEVALARAGGDPEDPAWVQLALHDPMVTDLVLFEGGRLARFCDERGALLPADELELARAWVGAPLGLHDVTAARPGTGITLRNLRTGEVAEVHERAASTRLETGTMLFARLLPVGRHVQLSPSVLTVPFTLRDRLLALLDGEPDAIAVAAWFAAAEAPPELATTDGDPLVACTGVFRAADRDAAAAALDELFERQGDRWAEHRERDGERILVGALHFDGDLLSVETMSEPRFDELVPRVAGAVAGLEPLGEERIPAAELRDRSGGSLPSPGRALDDEQLAAALSAHMQEAERRWVDEAVPALGGATPRQAADDPTRRGDLERLLEEFEAMSATMPAGAASFDVARLRRLLGADG